MNITASTISANTITVGAIITNTVVWTVNREDDEGSAGVREPRRPVQPSSPAAMALTP